MKQWLALLNMIAAALIVYMISIAHNQIQVNERDFQSEILADAIDKSNQYAFVNSLKYSSLDQTYDELGTLALDPTNVIRDFCTMMCLCYNMSLSNENIKLVESCIDGGVLCDMDGYYILHLTDKPIYNEDDIEIVMEDGEEVKRIKGAAQEERLAVNFGLGGAEEKTHISDVSTAVDKELRWSLKLPYTYEGTDGTYALSLTNGDSFIYTNRGSIVQSKGTQERIEETRYYRHHDTEIPFTKVVTRYQYYNSSGAPINDLNDTIKLQVINNVLSTALNESTKNIMSARGKQMNYTVYLPSKTTATGVNPVKSNTLLLSMSKASFAGQYASLSEPVLSGFRAVSKEYLVGFRDADGIDRYCYASQLPESVTRDAMYYTTYEAIMDVNANGGEGRRPDMKYIHYPLMRELQSSGD